MKILITGCRGFVGGCVGRYAARAGHTVLGVARSGQPEQSWPGEYVQADVLHADLSGLVRDFSPDVVLHAAGTASVGASLQAPLDDLRAAILTWANTLDSIRRSGMRPVVLFPSSASVYGSPSSIPISETAPTAPISPYGFHKLACELVAREYAECFGLPVVICRIFSVFGTAQRRLLVWEIYRQLAGDGDTVWLEGTGMETRDYLHVDDLAQAMLEIATLETAAPSADARIINFASGTETRVSDLARQMRDLLAPGKDVRCRGTERPGNPARWRADITRLQQSLPRWQPQPLAEALALVADRWRQETP